MEKLTVLDLHSVWWPTTKCSNGCILRQSQWVRRYWHDTWQGLSTIHRRKQSNSVSLPTLVQFQFCTYNQGKESAPTKVNTTFENYSDFCLHMAKQGQDFTIEFGI